MPVNSKSGAISPTFGPTSGCGPAGVVDVTCERASEQGITTAASSSAVRRECLIWAPDSRDLKMRDRAIGINQPEPGGDGRDGVSSLLDPHSSPISLPNSDRSRLHADPQFG